MNNFEFLITADWKNTKSYDKFLNLLQSLAKYESAIDREHHIKILNTHQKVYALSMADIRLIAKNISKGDHVGFLKAVKYNSYEEVTIAGIVIALIKDLSLQTKLLTDWTTKIDNWSSCDTVVSTMKTLKNNKNKSKYFEHYKNMCLNSREFVARVGIICLMVNYLEEAYIDDILYVCKQINHPGYYVKMAVAWLISFAFMKFRDKTYTLLKEKCLDKFTQNKAICKCHDSYQVSAEDKQTLISLRIK